MPGFAYSRRSESMTGQKWEVQRTEVNEKFERLIEVADSGDYSNLRVIYPEPLKRNAIVRYLYDFTNSFGATPVEFANLDESNGEVIPTYKISKFRPSVKDLLLELIAEPSELETETGVGFGKVKYTTKGKKTIKKVLNLYKGKNTALEYAPEVIITAEHIFNLRLPLRCLFEQEGDYFVIQSELLNVIGTGATEEEAEASFSEEFEFIYQKLNSLEENALTENNKMIKSILNHYVLSIES